MQIDMQIGMLLAAKQHAKVYLKFIDAISDYLYFTKAGNSKMISVFPTFWFLINC